MYCLYNYLWQRKNQTVGLKCNTIVSVQTRRLQPGLVTKEAADCVFKLGAMSCGQVGS